MAKNYFDRYIWLIDTINRHGHIFFSDISYLWARSPLNKLGENYLPERTFHNHRQAILDTFGIEIKCDRSMGYYIANDEDLEEDGIRQWLLNSLSLNNLMNESREMRDRILFEEIPSSQRWLTAIVNAIKDQKTIEMTYQSFNRTEPNTFEAHPWCLKLFKQRWYLLARSEAYTEPRIYALDRIRTVKETKNPLIVPKKFKADEFFRHFFGIIVDERKPETIRLKVDDDQVKYYKSLPLHSSQKEIETTEEYTVFQYQLIPTFDFMQEILSKGRSVEILAPESFRDEIHAEIKAMLARYE
ncbi:MAG: WYL domain-containing protein [Bacteroidales bacterium]|nr:WYL domain-containing protein [Bacteroidales bacterium]